MLSTQPLLQVWKALAAPAGELGRRRLLRSVGLGGAVALAAPLLGPVQPALAIAEELRAQTAPGPNGLFSLPPLPYAYDALEPAVDAPTMVFHHDRHHATYVNELNAAIAPYPSLRGTDATTLISNLAALPEAIRTTVRNNGGGHVNHSIFWAIMGPGGGAPSGALATAINATFGSLDGLKQQVNTAGDKQFGSGWSWLVSDAAGKLQVMSTPNQDSPYTMGLTPLLGVDVWEHAYYLRYQNRRTAYLEAWWSVVNWVAVGERYASATRPAPPA